MPPEIKSPAPGDMNHAGRFASLTNARVKPFFSSRPEKRDKKGGLNPHGYYVHAALTNTTSLRTFRLLGRLASGTSKD